MYYARRAEPRSSKLLYDREVKARHKRHQARLRRMKASVDNGAPKRFVHLERNLKKEQLQEDRYAQIEHENRLLLHRMSEIMNRRSIDNKSKSHKFGKSLNRSARKQEMDRITRDNQKILRRIQGAEPVYNHWKWEEEGMKHAKLVDSISEYGGSKRSTSRIRPHAAAAAASMSTGVASSAMPGSSMADMGGYDGSGAGYDTGAGSYGAPGGYGDAGGYGGGGGGYGAGSASTSALPMASAGDYGSGYDAAAAEYDAGIGAAGTGHSLAAGSGGYGTTSMPALP